jgi:hypothetical protein
MPETDDFRGYAFSRSRIGHSARYVGRTSYWKLYAIENYLRVVIHSVLKAQLGAEWWDIVIDDGKKEEVEKMKAKSARLPGHTSSGRHDVYYLYLSDLVRIMTATRHLLISSVPDIDEWRVRIDQVRHPRNLVGHMNFPATSDRSRIDALYADLNQLISRLERDPVIALEIP